MEILDNEEITDIITWLPHGRGFTITDKKRFAAEVMPIYFKESKYTSFTRRLNRWKFTIQTQGHKKASYYHPEFVKGDVQSCQTMRPIPQPARRKKRLDIPNVAADGTGSNNLIGRAHSDSFAMQGSAGLSSGRNYMGQDPLQPRGFSGMGGGVSPSLGMVHRQLAQQQSGMMPSAMFGNDMNAMSNANRTNLMPGFPGNFPQMYGLQQHAAQAQAQARNRASFLTQSASQNPQVQRHMLNQYQQGGYSTHMRNIYAQQQANIANNEAAFSRLSSDQFMMMPQSGQQLATARMGPPTPFLPQSGTSNNARDRGDSIGVSAFHEERIKPEDFSHIPRRKSSED